MGVGRPLVRRSAWSKSRNPILYMSEEELRGTSLDQLLELYGPQGSAAAAGGGGGGGGRRLLGRRGRGGGNSNLGQAGCDGDFGVALVNRWRKAAKECCHPHGALAMGGGVNGTRLVCHLAHQTRHAGAGDQLLYGENVRVNFKDLVRNGGQTPKKYFTDYVKSRHNQGFSKIKWSRGTMAGTCTPDSEAGWQQKFFPGWNVNWHTAFEEVKPGAGGGGGGGDPLACDVWVEEPTLIVERDTFANFFHNSEDFFNTFIALAILRWPVNDLQILITDIFPKGPFWPIWSKVFRGGAGRNPEPLTAWDIAKK